ncbi:transposase IS200 like protein [Clostridium tepidiprofundi DSM 19306]|uniref:Transposase IS200 like protein n=1 Tax=Clostridium tepidiprofundi DSM 19306 TaxID=1121338 RepID=A0A151B2Z1_9CLOT|nr:transposase [Clostridium tepidiprofundi]KYH34275.1 transposase IS200 like protein [Clostridium tepidiprofundi DSM 19306]
MVTPKRIWFPGATYHITARGNRKQEIFRDKQDFIVYLAILKDCLEYYKDDKYEIIAYCLMTNHVHILIKTTVREISDFIQRLHSMYARYFNKKYNYVGHLWQDKFYAELIKSNKQMLDTSRYIHLNPAKAKIVKKPEEYKWSSYAMYIGKREEKIISTEMVLSLFEELTYYGQNDNDYGNNKAHKKARKKDHKNNQNNNECMKRERELYRRYVETYFETSSEVQPKNGCTSEEDPKNGCTSEAQ